MSVMLKSTKPTIAVGMAEIISKRSIANSRQRMIYNNYVEWYPYPNNSQFSEQRGPARLCRLARPRTCLHDWSSRDEIQLLLKLGTNIQRNLQKSLILQQSLSLYNAKRAK
jgi:hypothetical protein